MTDVRTIAVNDFWNAVVNEYDVIRINICIMSHTRDVHPNQIASLSRELRFFKCDLAISYCLYILSKPTILFFFSSETSYS